MRPLHIVTAAAIAACLAVAGCASLPVPAGTPGVRAQGAGMPHGHLAKFADSGRVTYSAQISNCRARDHGRLPDRACTPGSVNPAVTQANISSTICQAGWTAQVRPPESQTARAKYDTAYPAYGVPDGTTSELDHLVPLELGGSNDITNLWPEAGTIPNPKDSTERALNHAVCDRTVSLRAAQRAIARNWETAEKRLRITSGGQ